MIVGCGHQQRRGKDSVAKFLELVIKMRIGRAIVRRRSFAESLKASCFQLYSWAGLQRGIYYENHPEEKEVVLPKLNKTPRQIWIDFGNAVRNRVHPDTFAASVLHDYIKMKNDFTLITDLRYPNEANLIHKMGGICIQILRASLPEPTDEADTALNGYGEWDLVIFNNGSLSDLQKQAESLADIVIRRAG